MSKRTPPLHHALVDATAPDLADSALYLHRELSQLEFNRRLLDQADDTRTPLLERLKFLLLFSRNMDEFFEIRVAGLKGQVALEHESLGPDGIPPQRALVRISVVAHELIARQYAMLNTQLLPALAAQGIRIVRRGRWSAAQRDWVRHYFQAQVAPLVTPIGLDPTHPFPRLVNKSLNFIVRLAGVDAFGRDSGLAVLPAPRVLPRLIAMPQAICAPGDNYALLSSVIHAHAGELFPGMQVLGCYQFRLTRNADLTLDPEDVEDLAHALRSELYANRFGDGVRLEVADNCPRDLVDYLLRQFALDESELYEVNGPVNLARLFRLVNTGGHPQLRFAPFVPALPGELQHTPDMFAALARGDILLLHPYQSFAPVIDLLRQAARDPHVLAIKQTLYRTSASSEIVDALVEAALAGKEVTAVVELRARFNEASNLSLASRLQQAGVTVVYGVVGIKTHAKAMLIQRSEGRGFVRYAHLGTGNYHAGNARVYVDYSLLTADATLCADVHALFSQLTGMSALLPMRKLLSAPFALRTRLTAAIAREAGHARQRRPAAIIIKVNALTDAGIMHALYAAGMDGVQIDLIVRGKCALRPGVPGVSDNIRVRSIVGRFLEHSRVYFFANAGEPQLYLSSADLMDRNLDRRVETAFPLTDPVLHERVRRELQMYLDDTANTSLLQADGSYRRVAEPAAARDVQMELLQALCGAGGSTAAEAPPG